MILYAIYHPETDTYYSEKYKCLDCLSSTTKFYDYRQDAEKAIECCNNDSALKEMGYSQIHHILAWDFLEKKHRKDRWDINCSWHELASALNEFKDLEVRKIELNEC